MRVLLFLLALPVMATITKSPAACGSHPCTITISACASAICDGTESAQLQTALDDTAGQCGDTIVVPAGYIFTGSYTFSRLPGGSCSASNKLLVTSSLAARLSAAGTQLTTSHSANLPKIRGANGTAPDITFTIKDGATPGQYLKFRGIEFLPCTLCMEANPSSASNELLKIGEGTAATAAQMPLHIEAHQCYFHVPRTNETRNGVTGNGRWITLRDSIISGVKMPGTETHAFVTWTGNGPFEVDNNWLEGAGIPVFIGGGNVSPTTTLPSDGRVTKNIFNKPAAWFNNTYVLKVMFEIKFGKRWQVYGNKMQGNYHTANSGGQAGFAISVKANPYNLDPSTWGTEDISIHDNWIHKTLSGVTMQGSEERVPDGSIVARNVSVVNNLFTSMGCLWDTITNCGGPSSGNYKPRILLFTGSGQNFRIAQNTFVPGESTTVTDDITAIYPDTATWTGLDLVSNFASQYDYFIKGNSLGIGQASVDAAFAAPVTIKGNAFPGATGTLACTAPRICAANSFPSAAQYAANYQGWKNPTTFDYSLAATSPYYHAGHVGQSIGVDLPSLYRIEDLVITPATYTATFRYRVSGPARQTPCVMEAEAMPSTLLRDDSEGWVVPNAINPNLFLHAETDGATNARNRTFTIGSTNAAATTLDGGTADQRLTPGTTYTYRLTCAGDSRTGSFTTL